MDQYADKITQKLGRKGGITKDGVLDQYYSASTSTSSDETDTPSTSDDMETFLPDDEEADLTEQISLKLAERIGQEADAERQARRALSPTGSALGPTAEDIAEAMERELALKEQQTPALDDAQNSDAGTTPQTTSGIGGSWAANATSSPESYRPANGGWGYFPRPKDISKAYGGGKRIGAGVTTSREEEDRMAAEEENTKERLKRYREKVGIDVESEKENKEEIEEALEIGQRAMQVCMCMCVYVCVCIYIYPVGPITCAFFIRYPSSSEYHISLTLIPIPITKSAAYTTWPYPHSKRSPATAPPTPNLAEKSS